MIEASQNINNIQITKNEEVIIYLQKIKILEKQKELKIE